MRSEAKINADIAAARSAYHEAVHTQPAPAVKAISDRVRQFQAELSAALADGAKPCPVCGNLPHGMLKTPAVYVGRLLKIPAVYEVGCLACPPAVADDPKTRHAAQGNTAADAVAAWNDGLTLAASAATS